MNFLHNFRKRSELQPGVPALIDHCFSGDRVLSYSSLNKLADYLSIELREQKIQVGDRVLLALDSGQELYGYLLATLQIGAIPIIYQQDGSHKEYVSWVKALNPHAVVIRRERWVGCHFDSALKPVRKKIYVGQVRSQARWLRLGKLGAVEERAPNAPAISVLTADSSGKLSMRSWSQKQLDLSVQFYLSHLKLKAGEIDLCQTPLQLLTNLSAGLTSVIAEDTGLLALAKVERRIEKFKPTRIAGESALIRRLLRKYSSPLHKVFITDAPLNAESFDFFKGHVQHANIELLFCSELPLASLSIRGFEEKGDASLAGPFFPEIEAGIVPEPVDENASIEAQLTREPSVRGKLIIKSEFLPHWQTEPKEELADIIEHPVHNGVWHSTGMTGFMDDQKRFWLVRKP